MTCLVLTRNRRPWLPYALQCAQYQTYPNTEILVISSGDDVSDLIPPGVRHLHLSGNPLIGAKRNTGASESRGEVVAHFDDDDFSHPGRLADQVGRLVESGMPVTGYRSMRFTDGEKWWQYEGPSADYALGTSLVYRREFWAKHPFPAIKVGEDNAFVSKARERSAIASVDAGEFMWATIHRQNTSPRSMNSKQWKPL